MRGGIGWRDTVEPDEIGEYQPPPQFILDEMAAGVLATARRVEPNLSWDEARERAKSIHRSQYTGKVLDKLVREKKLNFDPATNEWIVNNGGPTEMRFPCEVEVVGPGGGRMMPRTLSDTLLAQMILVLR